MEVYKESFVDEDEFDLKNIMPYFEKPFWVNKKYEILMDPLSIKFILAEYKRIKYNKLVVNIIIHSSVLWRMVEKEKNLKHATWWF